MEKYRTIGSGKTKMLNILKTRKKAAVLAGIVLIGLAVIFLLRGKNEAPAAQEESTMVHTMTIAANAATQNYTYSGEVRGRYESKLAFQVKGKIVSRNVQLGSSVAAGDVLMQIDGKDIVQTVNNNAALVDSAESELELAQSDLSRYQELVNGGVISQATYDKYVNAYHVSEAKVRQTQAQYTQSVNEMDYSSLQSDKAGVISSISAEVGQVVSPGQVVVTLVQDGEREIEINVPENRIEDVRQAQDIKVNFWALGNESVSGLVREIAPMADPNTRTFKVRIRIPNPPADMKLGMTATVSIPRSDGNLIKIPIDAIYQNSESPAVWKIKDDELSLCPIQIGNYGSDTVEVLSGLQEGDCIVTKGVHMLTEGQKVKSGGDSL